MAAFRQHLAFSTVLGGAYAGVLCYLGADWTQAALAGLLCSVSGMLPDLDSDSGRPIQEMFGLIAAILPLLLAEPIRELGVTTDGTILLMAGLYALIRFGASNVLRRLSVHRGMFHSIPAAIIAAELIYLAHRRHDHASEWLLSTGVLIGFMSHLMLDEIYAVDFNGLAPRLNKAAGSALKFFSSSIPATLFTWLVLGLLTYFVGVREGYFKSLPLSWHSSFSVSLSVPNPINK